MSLPERNIYWRALWGSDARTPQFSRIELRGAAYVATLLDGEEAVPFWNDLEARLAQAALDKAVKRTK